MADRTEEVHMRVTPEEKKMLMTKAAAYGVTVTSLIIAAIGSELLGEKLGDKILEARKKTC